MRALCLALACLSALLTAAVPAAAECTCKPATLDQRIHTATAIFTGKPLGTAPVPSTGTGPFHSGEALDTPLPSARPDLVTLFKIDTLWKGNSKATIRVRHVQGECGMSFDPQVAATIFAEADESGILWTGRCSGDAKSDERGYDDLQDALGNRLHYQ